MAENFLGSGGGNAGRRRQPPSQIFNPNPQVQKDIGFTDKGLVPFGKRRVNIDFSDNIYSRGVFLQN